MRRNKVASIVDTPYLLGLGCHIKGSKEGGLLNSIILTKSYSGTMFNKRQLEIREFFNLAADKYNDDRTQGGRIFNELIEIPATLEMIGSVQKGDKVLDVGCGIGYYSKHYGDELAEVVGIDISDRMLEISKHKCRHCPYVHFENSSLENFRTNIKFDIIVGGFMLGYFDDLKEILSKIESLLAPNGRAVMSMLHPVRLSALDRTLFGYIVGNYFDEKYYRTDLNMNFGELTLRKWNVEDISIAAEKSGLVISQIREPVPITTRSKRFNKKELKFYKNNPSVIAFKFEKE